MPPVAAVHHSSRIDEIFSGGPAGLIYGFILVWAGTAAVFASLSELASMYAQVNTIKFLLTSAGHLLPEASITGFPCSRHVLHKSSSAISQARSSLSIQFPRFLIIYRLAHSLGLAG